MFMAGKLPPRHPLDQAKLKVAQYISARLKEESKERGDAAKIAAKIRFTDAAVANAKNHMIMGDKLVRALAAYWGMTIDELEQVAMGDREPPQASPSPSPTPPPADSDVRTRPTAAHWFPDEVEATFAEALQHPDAPRLAGPSAAMQLLASKVTYRDRMTNLAPDVAVEFCVQLLWAAKALDDAGTLGAADDEVTKGALLSEVYRRSASRPLPPRPEVGTSAKVLTSRAHADMDALGVVPSPAALERRRKADEAKAKKGKG